MLAWVDKLCAAHVISAGETELSVYITAGVCYYRVYVIVGCMLLRGVCYCGVYVTAGVCYCRVYVTVGCMLLWGVCYCGVYVTVGCTVTGS